MKSESSRRLKTLKTLQNPTSEDVISFLSTLKLLETVSHVLDSHLTTELLWLFRSMTPVQRAEVIGLLAKMNLQLGRLFEAYSKTQPSPSSSKTGLSI